MFAVAPINDHFGFNECKYVEENCFGSVAVLI